MKVAYGHLALLAGALALSSCGPGEPVTPPQTPPETPPETPPADVFTLPEGYEIEQVVGGLTYPTSLTWDDAGTLYVAEAGGGLNPEQLTPSRILRVENAQTQELVNLTDEGVFASVVGLTFSDGTFFVTHRNEGDLTGAVSSVSMNGEVTELFSGILDSQSEHQINDIRVGPDGRLYVSVGPAGNSGVMDDSVAPWVAESPDVRATPCQDIVLTGQNFQTPDFRTMDDPDDMVLTGAFVPFGTATTPGQVIPGTNKCGGSILAFDPDDAEATLEVYAWGFRNLLGLAWDDAGTLYAAENGYDVRGSRPVVDELDATLRVEEGTWYGVPDYSAGREPLSDPKFDAPDEFQAEVFVAGESQGRTLGPLIDLEASGLTAPNPSLVVGRHPWNSSPSMLDVAPASWGRVCRGPLRRRVGRPGSADQPAPG